MKCPGQDMQYWTAEAIYEVDCPKCGQSVEFYKDDTTRNCGHCGHRFVNPKMDFGCAAYCKFAEQCIGTLPEEFTGPRENLLKDKVAVEVKRYYKSNFGRISFASRVARYAEKIGKEEGISLAIVLCAAYLNDIGNSEIENRSEHRNPKLTGKETLDIASSILGRLGASEEVIREVCCLLDTEPGKPKQSAESRTLQDACLIARLEDRMKKQTIPPEELESSINEQILTDSGRRLAQTLLTQP